jgi:hypothetical protein
MAEAEIDFLLLFDELFGILFFITGTNIFFDKADR